MDLPSLTFKALVQTISATRLGAFTYKCTVLYPYKTLHYKMWCSFYHFRRAGVPLAKMGCAPSCGHMYYISRLYILIILAAMLIGRCILSTNRRFCCVAHTPRDKLTLLNERFPVLILDSWAHVCGAKPATSNPFSASGAKYNWISRRLEANRALCRAVSTRNIK